MTSIAQKIADQFPAYVGADGLVGHQQLDGALAQAVETSAYRMLVKRAEEAEQQLREQTAARFAAERRIVALDLALTGYAETAITAWEEREQGTARLLDRMAALVEQREDLLMTRDTQAQIITNLQAQAKRATESAILAIQKRREANSEIRRLHRLILAIAASSVDADDPGHLFVSEQIAASLRAEAERIKGVR